MAFFPHGKPLLLALTAGYLRCVDHCRFRFSPHFLRMDPFVDNAPSTACLVGLKLNDVLRNSTRVGQIHYHEGDHVHTDDH